MTKSSPHQTKTTVFLKHGDKYKVTSQAALDLHQTLPCGTYAIGVDAHTGEHYLQGIDDFTLPAKLYGSTTCHVERILTTFQDRPASTGVLLAGQKGSGKTLLAKAVATTAAAQHGIPTIVINRALYGETFNAFLQSIKQPAIVLFDEFEKVYSGHGEQEALLTLLDGVYPSKKLFLLTCNDKNRIDSHFRNRPGRVYYTLNFTGLGPDFCREYCADNLYPELRSSKTAGVVACVNMFEHFNMDMLKAIVEEINRYGESAQEVLKYLNIDLDTTCSGNKTHKTQLFVDGMLVPLLQNHEWYGNPLTDTIKVGYIQQIESSDKAEDVCSGCDDECDECGGCCGGRGFASRFASFTAHDMQEMNVAKGKYVFVNDQSERLVLTRNKEKVGWDLDKLLTMTAAAAAAADEGPSPKKQKTAAGAETVSDKASSSSEDEGAHQEPRSIKEDVTK